MMPVIVRRVGAKRSIGGRRVLMIRGDVTCQRLRLEMLLIAGIVLVVVPRGRISMVRMPLALMAIVGRMLSARDDSGHRLAGRRYSG